MNKLELKVEGMVCTGCENRLKNAILQMKNVKNVEASFVEKKVIGGNGDVFLFLLS